MGPGMELTTSISRQTTGNTSELPTATVGTTWRLRSPDATMRHVSLSCRECRRLGHIPLSTKTETNSGSLF